MRKNSEPANPAVQRHRLRLDKAQGLVSNIWRVA